MSEGRSPPRSMVPETGRCSPTSARSNVVFPAPFGSDQGGQAAGREHPRKVMHRVHPVVAQRQAVEPDRRRRHHNAHATASHTAASNAPATANREATPAVGASG